MAAPSRRSSIRRSSVEGGTAQGLFDALAPPEQSHGGHVSGGVDPHAPVPFDVVTPLSGSGLNTSVRDAILVLNRNEVVFALGKFAVVHNIQSQELTFVGGQQPEPHAAAAVPSTNKRPNATHSMALGEITAMVLCGKRHYLSICRTATRDGTGSGSGGGATVSIHSLRGLSSSSPSLASRQYGTRQKTLGYHGTDRFNCTTLSTDGKLVCCQCANVSWTIVVWDWSRERQIAVTDVHGKVSRVRFNVIDMAQLSTCGGNQLKLWTLSEYTLKSFASFKSGDETRARHKMASYVDHVWLPDDCLVALLDDGSVQLIINGELVQTVQALANRTRAYCIVTQNNGEAGVLVGGSDGSLASLRIVAKLMKAGEKEMHLQRRMTVSNAQNLYSMGVDATGSVLVCCTEKFYGSYDLSNLCLLLGDDELVTLNPLASTPFVASLMANSLSIASRRPCFGALAKLPSDEDAVLIWNQLDGNDCVVAHVLDHLHASPLSMDIHPTGAELIVSFPNKVVIFFLLQDALRVAFEVPAKHASHIAYSPSGSHFILAQAATRVISVYRTCGLHQREPELVGLFQGVEDQIEHITWALNDSSFFYAVGGSGHSEIRHCQILAGDEGGDVEEAITADSAAKTLHPSRHFVGVTRCRIQRDSHDYVVFAVEKEPLSASSTVVVHASESCGRGGAETHGGTWLRAWLNGNLSRDALVTGNTAGLFLRHDVTAIASGPGKMLLLGTAHGLVLLLYWKMGRLNGDGTRNIFVMAAQRQVDLHAAPVAGLIYSRSTQSIVSCDSTGVVLVASIQRQATSESSGSGEHQRRQLLATASNGNNGLAVEEFVYSEPSQTFVSVCQADEVAVYDRSTVELRKLKQLEVEGELQQVKLENEILNKQLRDQKERLDGQLKTELQKQNAQVESTHNAQRLQWETQLRSSQETGEKSVLTLREDAQLANDQYVASTERLQKESERLKKQLLMATQTIEDLKLSANERETQLRNEYDTSLRTMETSRQEERQRFETELEMTRRQLKEALAQQDQDQLTQLSILSAAVDTEKSRAANQLSQIQGKMAALHQEVKMLLAALNQKDHDVQMLRERHDRDTMEIASLKELVRKEKDHAQQLTKDKKELLAAAQDQKLIRDNLQRLNNVHRSQIELLQKNLLPKEKELDQMQQHLNQLHSVNQEIVIQANVSDRLRKESGARAKQNECEVVETNGLLDRVRNSIVVLQDELGELVKQSAVQEKSAIVGEIMRIHKRIARQIDVLQAKDGRVEEVSAELHRQNQFLMKNKQHLRRQMEITYKEKHKLVSALSFQNTSLMNELNAVRKQNKELERNAKRCVLSAQQSATYQDQDHGYEHSDGQAQGSSGDVDVDLDGRRVMATTTTAAPIATSAGQPLGVRPGSASTSSRRSLGGSQPPSRSTTMRPKSAAPRATRR